MVDLALLQSVSYIAGAIGVCVAAVYYIVNLSMSQRKAKIDTTNQLLQLIVSREGVREYLELLNMEWKDYDDFEKKYGTDYNFDSAVSRIHIWFTYDSLGHSLMNGLADLETIYDSAGVFASWTWEKFKPIIEEHRRRYTGPDQYVGWEYLAGEMMKIKRKRSPSFKIPETFTRYVPEK